MRKLGEEETRLVELITAYEGTDSDMQELSHLIETVSNNILFPEDELLSEIFTNETGKKNIFELAVNWISYWGLLPENRYYGMQNDYSGRICCEIVRNGLLDGLEGSKFDGLIQIRRKYGSLQIMHRTLMQTFSRLLFHAIHLLDNENARRIDQKMTELHDEYWYCCPFV